MYDKAYHYKRWRRQSKIKTNFHRCGKFVLEKRRVLILLMGESPEAIPHAERNGKTWLFDGLRWRRSFERKKDKSKQGKGLFSIFSHIYAHGLWQKEDDDDQDKYEDDIE